jgi:Rod binding domain-containing protein
MQTSALQRPVAPAELSAENLAGNRHVSEHDKVAELSKRFEAILVRQILTEAHRPAFKSTMALGNSGAAIHQDMLVNELANQITSSGGLGLAGQLTQALSRQLTPETDPAAGQQTAPPPAKLTFKPEPIGSTSSLRWTR